MIRMIRACLTLVDPEEGPVTSLISWSMIGDGLSLGGGDAISAYIQRDAFDYNFEHSFFRKREGVEFEILFSKVFLDNAEDLGINTQDFDGGAVNWFG